MSDALLPRLRLALGRTVQLGDELPATGGVRSFAARLPGEAGPPTHRLVLAPASPDGPTAADWQLRAAALQAAAHAALAPLVASGEFEGRGWWVEGALPLPLLSTRLHERGPASVRETITVLREVARVLVALHRRGIVHGGIGVDAVHLAGTGRVVVAHGPGAGAPEEDLAALGRLGRAMLAADRAGARRHPPPELLRLLDRLVDADPRRRPTRAEEVLTVLDAFPARHASPLGALFEGAGRGARTAERHPALLVVSLAALGLLFYVLVAQAR